MSTDVTELASLSLNSHQDVLDFVDHCLEESSRWMAVHDSNFSKRYIDLNINIVVRVEVGRADSVYDFVLSAVPSGRVDQRGRQVASGPLSLTESTQPAIGWTIACLSTLAVLLMAQRIGLGLPVR